MDNFDEKSYTLDELSYYIERERERGVYSKYIYMNDYVWNKFKEKYSMHEILSLMRKYRVRRIYVHYSYKIKEIGIWL